MADNAVTAPTTAAKPTLPAMQMTLGDTGLKAFSGFLQEEFLTKLSGDQGKRVYREMSDNDATIGAILEVFSSLIGGVEWTVTAANDDVDGEAAKKFLEEVIEDMDTPMSDIMAEVATMFTYGFAPMEITYKTRNGDEPVGEEETTSKFDDGKFGIAAVALRAQNTILQWDIDPKNGKTRGLWQQTTWKSRVYIPASKIALFRTTNVKNSPEGRSVLRRAYRSWFFKKTMEEIEAIGVERDLAGYPLLRIPAKYMDPNATPEDKAFYAACQRLITQMRRESREGAVIASDVYVNDQGQPTGVPLMDLKLLTSGGTRTFDTNAIIGRYDRAMAMSVLMDFMFLGQGNAGSWALSDDKTSLSARIVGSYLKRAADVLNKQVFAPLMRINGWKAKSIPTVTPGDLEKQNLDQLASMISALAGAGMPLFPDRELENHLRKQLGVPLAPEEGMGDQGVPGAEAEDDEQLKRISKAIAAADASLERDHGWVLDDPARAA